MHAARSQVLCAATGGRPHGAYPVHSLVALGNRCSGNLQPTGGQATTSRTWGISGTRLTGPTKSKRQAKASTVHTGSIQASKPPNVVTASTPATHRHFKRLPVLILLATPRGCRKTRSQSTPSIAKDGKTLELPTSSPPLLSVQSFGHHLMNTNTIRAAHPLISPARAVICFLLDVPLSSYTPRLATLNESTYPDTDIDYSFAKLRPIVNYVLAPPDDSTTAEAPSSVTGTLGNHGAVSYDFARGFLPCDLTVLNPLISERRHTGGTATKVDNHTTTALLPL
ncbi:hypothetical protein HDV57DRAFT_523125 [Trichoderma longibrachiatum]